MNKLKITNFESPLPVSFPSALQLRVSFGPLNNLPPFFSILHQVGLPIFLVVYILF
jgi:hypothetical protein